MKDRDAARVLLVIDVQHDFCPGGSLAVERGDEVVPIINRLIPRFTRVAATQDWHPPGHVSFAASHPGARPLDSVVSGGITQVLWPDHCVQGSRGAELHAGLDGRGISLVLRKGARRELDSYSAFFENDGTTSTGLSGWTAALGIRVVYLCGLATDYCVFHTAMDARRLGLDVCLLLDACRGVDLPAGRVDQAVSDMKAAGVRITETAAVD
jgi:nicotinamidase/pyrazinamidase